MRDRRKPGRALSPGLLPVLAATVLSGCTNLTSVQMYARASAEAVEVPEVLSAYATAPTRMARLEPAEAGKELAAVGRERERQRARMAGAQRVLGAYFRSLHDLAAGTLPSVDPEIGAIGTALEEAGAVGAASGGMSREALSAAGSLAKVLGRWALEGYRQSRLQEVIREADPPLRVVVAGLAEAASRDLAASLDQEAEAVGKYFGAASADATSRGLDDAAGRLSRYLEAEAADRVEVRRQQLKAYLAVLRKVGSGHADLAANAEKLDAATLRTRLMQVARDLETLSRAVRTLAG